MGTIGLWIALIVLLAFSAFFSATETAYTSFSTVRMRRLAIKKRSARLALRLSEDYNKILTTLLLGNNIVNIAGSTISTIIFIELLGGELGPTISTVVLTAVVVVFCEITPKTVAREAPEAFALFAAYPLAAFTYLFYPLNVLFGLWKKLVLKILRLDKKKPKITEEEFKLLVSDVADDGVLNANEHDLITKSLRFDDLHVGSCMIPLDRVIAVEARENSRLVYKLFRETNFSRIPVYKGSKGNIIGVLYRADFYENLLSGREDFANILRPVSWTTADEKISDQLERMQTLREHMVLVGGEGNALGLITREDIIGELLGDLDDKFDLTPDTEPIQPFIPEPQNPESVDDTEE